MPFCSRCGVELPDNSEKCPLCGSYTHLTDNKPVMTNLYPKDDLKIKYFSEKEINYRKYIIWMVLSFLLLIPFFVILSIGYQTNGLKTWAGYPLISIVYSWFIITFLLFLYKIPLLLITLISLFTTVLLFYIDIFDGHINWFFSLTLPICILFFIISIIVAIILIAIKSKGIDIIGFILLGVSIFLIGLEIIINNYLKKSLIPAWSIIVFSVLLPLSLLLIWLNHHFKDKFHLDRFFHI